MRRYVLGLLCGVALAACQDGITPTAIAPESSIAMTRLGEGSLVAPLFDNFSFGYAHLQENPFPLGEGPASAQFASGPWVLTQWESGFHSTWLDTFRPGGTNANKVPYVYFYLTAGLARAELGLQDCNVGSPNLCQNGANYLRQNQNYITQRYQDIATQLASQWGTQAPILIHLEPDFFQYAQTFNTQQQNPLSLSEAQGIINTWIDTIKGTLPNAQIVLDVSPWNPDLSSWFGGMNLSQVSYIGLVGKPFPANNSVIDANRYSDMFAATGKQIIVNTTYGAGGFSAGYNYDWDDRSNLNAVAAAGVIGIIQSPQPIAHYETIIQSYLAAPVGGGTPSATPTPSSTPTPAPTSTPTHVPTSPPSGTLSATFQVDNQWNTGYCGVFEITAIAPVSDWTLQFSLPSGSISSTWSGQFLSEGTLISTTPLAWNRQLAAGQSIEVGMCVNGSDLPQSLAISAGSSTPTPAPTPTPTPVPTPTPTPVPTPTPTPVPTPTPTPVPTPTPTPAPTPTPTPAPTPTPTPVPTPTPTPVPTPTPTPVASASLTARFVTQSQWQNGYCGAFTIRNSGTAPVTGWQVQFGLNDASISSSWNSQFTQTGNQATAAPIGWNSTIWPGQEFEVGFCASVGSFNSSQLPQAIAIQ